MEKTFNIIEKWSERKVNSKKFNEAFQVDGIPLWYFIEPSVKALYFPKTFKILAKIEENIENNKIPSFFDNMRFNISSFILRKGLMINEKIKLLISRSKQESVGDKDVLFVVYTNQISESGKKIEYAMLGYLVDTLKKIKIRPLVLVCDPFSKNSFFKILKYENTICSYVTPEAIKESKKKSEELNRKWKTLDEKTKIKLFTFQGRNYWKFFKNEINFLFSKEVVFNLIKYYLTFKHIIKKHDLKMAYLLGDAGFIETPTCLAFYKLNRMMLSQLCADWAGYPLLKKEFCENVFFTTTHAGKEKLLRWGAKNRNIFKTGSPTLDKIVQFKKRKIPKKAKKTISLLTTAIEQDGLIEEKEYFGIIRKVLVQINNAKNIGKIIIKLHPRDTHISEYASIVKSLNLKNVEILRNPPSGVQYTKDFLYSVISDSDLIVSFTSSIDVESLLLDKNVINIEVIEDFRNFEYKKATITIEKDDNLTRVINKVLSDKNLQEKLKREREEYLKKSFFKVDGKAHERTANLIRRLIKYREQRPINKKET